MEKKEEKIFRDIVKILEQDVPQEALAEGNPTPEQEAIALIKQELDRAREEGRKERTDELKQAFHEVFYKSGELWFNYIFEDGDTKAEQEAKGVVEDYWDEIISKLRTK